MGFWDCLGEKWNRLPNLTSLLKGRDREWFLSFSLLVHTLRGFFCDQSRHKCNGSVTVKNGNKKGLQKVQPL